MITIGKEFRPVDYEAKSITDTAQTLTTTKYYTAASNAILADYALCFLEGAQIRVRYDGTNPTSAVGTPIEVGQSFSLEGFDQLSKFRAIRTGGTSGTLHVNYFKRYRD